MVLKMSKYLGVVLLSFLVSTAYGMDNGVNRGEQGDDRGLTLVPVRQALPQKILHELSEVPTEFLGGSVFNLVGMGSVGDVYVKKTDVVSFIRTKVAERLVRITEKLDETQSKFSESEQALRQTSSRLEESATSLANAAAMERSLRETQRELDEIRHALRNSQFEKEAAELVITRERESRIALLTAKDGAEADSIAQKMRVRDLEDHVKEKDRIIAELRLAVAEKAKLTEDKQRFKRLLESKLEADTPRDGDDVAILEALISEKEAKELRLQSEIVRLEREKQEKEALIEQYKVSVHMGDPYNYIVDLINQPISEISDERLRVELLCVMTRTGQDLDQLSRNKPEKITARLIRTSRPTKDAYRKAGKNRDNDPAYIDYGFREIGNDFVGLGWTGPALRPDDYDYVGSTLEKNIKSAANILGKK
jgi:uncharacterized coiled-coil protein SlyX